MHRLAALLATFPTDPSLQSCQQMVMFLLFKICAFFAGYAPPADVSAAATRSFRDGPIAGNANEQQQIGGVGGMQMVVFPAKSGAAALVSLAASSTRCSSPQLLQLLALGNGAVAELWLAATFGHVRLPEACCGAMHIM